MKISFVIPAYNEEKAIPIVIKRIPLNEFKKNGFDVEILIVNNNSNDKTQEVAEKCGARVVFQKKQGYGFAYKKGFKEANGDIIITGDADDTYPFEDSYKFVQFLLNEKLDFITTNRFAYMDKKAMSLRNRIGNHFFKILVNTLFNMKLNDSWSGMWIFKKEILLKLNLISNGMSLSQEIKIEAYKKNFKVKEIPIHFQRERVGIAKLEPWKDGIKTLLFLIKKK